FIGGTLGAAFGTLVAPSYAPAAGVFGVLGMGAVFAGAARAPMTAVLLIMSVAAAVFVPGVLAYTIWSYKVFASRISVESINPDQGGLHPTLVRDSTQPEAHFGY
ncbi:MAG: chloride channel protein, partial [Actinomyces sp.]